MTEVCSDPPCHAAAFAGLLSTALIPQFLYRGTGCTSPDSEVPFGRYLPVFHPVWGLSRVSVLQLSLSSQEETPGHSCLNSRPQFHTHPGSCSFSGVRGGASHHSPLRLDFPVGKSPDISHPLKGCSPWIQLFSLILVYPGLPFFTFLTPLRAVRPALTLMKNSHSPFLAAWHIF